MEAEIDVPSPHLSAIASARRRKGEGQDEGEAHDLAASHPDQVKELSALYDAWAKRCQVVPPEQLPKARRTVPASND